jgi:hypothetical protein
MQAIMIYTAGIKLFMHLDASGMKHPIATLICFLVCAPLTAISSEIFYRAIDMPTQLIAHQTWAWVKN